MNNYITFTSTLEEPHEAAGEQVILHIKSLLESIGYQSEEPEVFNSYGWEIQVKNGSECYWSMVQASDEFLLIAEAKRSIWEKLSGMHPKGFKPFLEKLTSQIQSSDKFQDVNTFTKYEFEHLGHEA